MYSIFQPSIKFGGKEAAAWIPKPRKSSENGKNQISKHQLVPTPYVSADLKAVKSAVVPEMEARFCQTHDHILRFVFIFITATDRKLFFSSNLTREPRVSLGIEGGARIRPTLFQSVCKIAFTSNLHIISFYDAMISQRGGFFNILPNMRSELNL